VKNFDPDYSEYYWQYVTGSAKTGLIAHDRKFNFFCHKHQYTIKFHCQTEVALGGLFLLAAFPQPISVPYEWSGSIMELWWEGALED